MVEFAVGEKIRMEFSTFGDRFLSVITEVRDDGRLLVYAPVTDPVINRLRTDRRVFVRFAHEGMLFGFRSQVLNSVDSSSVLLELEKPMDVFDAEDRAEPRCSCRFPATVVGGDWAAQAVVEDMSANCSRVRFLNGGLEPGVEVGQTEVRLTFHPFDLGQGYSVDCVVRNIFVKDDQQYAVLEFKPEEADARERIARFIEAQVCCGIPRL